MSGGRTTPHEPDARPVLVTGGAGFIGSNLVHRLLARGHTVRILDNLSRPGAAGNLDWLQRAGGPPDAGGPPETGGDELDDLGPDTVPELVPGTAPASRGGPREGPRAGRRAGRRAGLTAGITGDTSGDHGGGNGSRPGRGRLELHVGDIRDRAAVRQAVRGVGAVFHLAAQVAVTDSLRDPVRDFEVNARGTLDLLEALRADMTPDRPAPALVFASTNKVYGDLEAVDMIELDQRYQPADVMLRTRGIGEQHGLCFRSPYGCSKGAADQYVLDYAHTFGLPATVLRMSCIYGPHQLGTEEQGWVAHFLRSAIQRTGVTIFGNGKQVRDVLFIEDLVDAFLRAWGSIDVLAGRAFNIGGGPRNGISLIELMAIIEELRGEPLDVRFAPWRPGDQRYYASNVQRFRDATGWLPRTGARAGVIALYDWLLAESASAPASASSPGAGAPGASGPGRGPPGGGPPGHGEDLASRMRS